MVGASALPSNVGGNSLTLKGEGLSVTANGSLTIVGRQSSDNTLTISEGASVEFYGLQLSNVTADAAPHSGNQVIVDDASLVIDGASLLIGYQTMVPSFANALRDNSVTVRNNGSITVSSPGSSVVNVGNASVAYHNILEVTNGGNFTIDGSNATNIGNTLVTNLGGNAVLIDDGGTFQTNGALNIYDYNQADLNNAGANRLVVGDGGTFKTSGSVNSAGLIQLDSGAVFTSSDTVTIEQYGLLQLADGASLAGKTLGGVDADLLLEVQSGGRFEAAGTGLASNVSTTVESGGAFAVGLAGAAAASSFDLDSALTLADGAIFEVSLFDGETMGSLILGSNASLTIDGGAIFSLVLEDAYIPVYGDHWTLFDGEIGNITGAFNLDIAFLPTLGEGLFWELGPNGGTWQLAVVPEPGSIVLLGVTGVASLFLRRRHKLI